MQKAVEDAVIVYGGASPRDLHNIFYLLRIIIKQLKKPAFYNSNRAFCNLIRAFLMLHAFYSAVQY